MDPNIDLTRVVILPKNDKSQTVVENEDNDDTENFFDNSFIREVMLSEGDIEDGGRRGMQQENYFYMEGNFDGDVAAGGGPSPRDSSTPLRSSTHSPTPAEFSALVEEMYADEFQLEDFVENDPGADDHFNMISMELEQQIADYMSNRMMGLTCMQFGEMSFNDTLDDCFVDGDAMDDMFEGIELRIPSSDDMPSDYDDQGNNPPSN